MVLGNRIILKKNIYIYINFGYRIIIVKNYWRSRIEYYLNCCFILLLWIYS